MLTFAALQFFSYVSANRSPAHAISEELQSATSSSSSPLDGLPAWVLTVMAFGCLILAAAVAGLTLGLMSLDSTALDIVMKSSDESQAKAARLIKPIREQGNLLLVTLLLSNTLAAELLPLVLDALVPGGIFSLIVSILSLMLFGEMIPQAICSRHPLYFGAKLIGFVKVLRIVMYPIAAPIAFLLDVLLGEELGTIYSREELKNLIDVHLKSKVLTSDESTILKGTLEFTQKTVDSIMTHSKNVFALDIDSVLDRQTMINILKKGHSRIPLYEGTKSNIICLLLVKQLILVNPDEQEPVPIRRLISNIQTNHKIRVAPAWECSKNTPIAGLLNFFQIGRSHMAVVYDDVTKEPDQRKFIGIVTIEDIIEEILQEEIVDETDLYIDNTNKQLRLIRNNEGRFVPSPQPATPTTSVRQSNEDLSKVLRMRDIDYPAIRIAGKPMNKPSGADDDNSTNKPNLSGNEIHLVGLPNMNDTSNPNLSTPLMAATSLPQQGQPANANMTPDDSIDEDSLYQQRYEKASLSEPSFGTSMLQDLDEISQADLNDSLDPSPSNATRSDNQKERQDLSKLNLGVLDGSEASSSNLRQRLSKISSRGPATSTSRINRLLPGGMMKNATVVRHPSWIAGPMLGVARRSGGMSLLEEDDNLMPEDVVKSELLQQVEERTYPVYDTVISPRLNGGPANSSSALEIKDPITCGTKLRPVPHYASTEREQVPSILHTNKLKRIASIRKEVDTKYGLRSVGSSTATPRAPNPSSSTASLDPHKSSEKPSYGSIAVNVSKDDEESDQI